MRFDPRAGARSLIGDAIGAKAGETLAIIAEDPRLGIYDAAVPAVVADVADEMGIAARIVPVGDHAGLDEIPAEVARALTDCDHVLFHSRLGDTLRFSDVPGSATKTMSYALDIGVLGGPSCTVPHRVMERIRAAYDAQANRARQWRVTCPLGTDISGSQDIERVAAGKAEDFTVTRYPVCAPRPLPCATASGVVAVANWLMASGNRKYPDDEVMLPEPVRAHIENGRIIGFEGPQSLVDKVRTQYRRVGDLFGLDPFFVHSWHAGMNPGCFYPLRATSGIERWGKVAFANPRYLHFHTCGNYAPGEIAWTLFDASAQLGGKDFWRDGIFTFLQSDAVQGILAEEGIAELEIRQDIGID
ncbi:MAG: hypothetical protein WBB85_01605 [Albidovulum sp.]|uniref:hypothetical protein n=1 Tax=Albidovulum sp. TaxID=1872424 RepID=UPI003CBFFCDF